MAYRNGNYAAFYVAEPFKESNLGANQARDFRSYNLLRAWKGQDASFPFVDAHNKNYNVRDGSDWELTLKPRLRERLRNSKNIILFLSSATTNSRALAEEIDYGINSQGLPVIVVYPEFSSNEDIVTSDNYFRRSVVRLWDALPVFRDSRKAVACAHVPYDKKLIRQALDDPGFSVHHMKSAGDYLV